ncbi:MAG TPA: serine hydrolase domain-containing protein [Chloroflexia bacterium]|nr:serine hydrolase domain-containing protein [Chloroflexia bacterium]
MSAQHTTEERIIMARPTSVRLAGVGIARLMALLLGAVVALMVVGMARASATETGASNTDTADFVAIEKYVQKEMEATRLPGAAVGIVHGDEIVSLKGFGNADPSGRPITSRTPFTIGSSTKAFTALAVMQLVEAGEVDLDAPVQRYLPWFRVADKEASSRITVRDLLNQTSGLPTREPGGQLTRKDDSDGALEGYARGLRAVELTAPVGETFQYSNTNFNVLGLIVQTVSGQSYEQYVQRRIFYPLDMSNSYTSPVQARKQGRAMGHRYWFGRPLAYEMPYNRAQLPSGFIDASAQDMTHYLISQLENGRFGEAQILSPDGISTLHEPAVPTGKTVMSGQNSASYAMGWFVGETNGVPTVSHSGDMAGFHSDMVLMPQQKLGIVFLTNGNNGLNNARIEAIAPGVVSLLAEKQPPPPHAGSSGGQSILMWILIVLVVQLLGVARSVILLRRWRSDPASGPHGWLHVTLRIVPFFVASLLWAVLVITGLTLLSGGSLLDLLVFSPDLGYSTFSSAGIALLWGLLRPVLVILALPGRKPPKAVGATKESMMTTTT